MTEYMYSQRSGIQSPNTLTVTQLNEFIKRTLENSGYLQNVYVKGEISNFKNHYTTGHLYFSVKDENSQINVVMFRSYASRLKFMPEDGMKVTLHGNITTYLKSGSYQLNCVSMEPDGIGALYIAYEQLKMKLEEEGLFAQEYKKAIPKIPTRIGVITSPTGAVIQDIRKVSARRYPLAEIILYPSLVQGDGAAAQLTAGIRYFNRTASVDVIIIGRGGGSFEDLWPFNDENLARAIFESEIPVISSVGHEVDFTICDFVADRRAATPSEAAELAVPDGEKLREQISNILKREARIIKERLDRQRENLNRYAKSPVLTRPMTFVDQKRMQLDQLYDSAYKAESLIYEKKLNELKIKSGKLEALNPLGVLARGFSAVYGDDGKLIKSVNDVEVGDSIEIRMSDGTAECEVKSKK